MATQISTLAFKLVADTREFTEGIVATKKELRAAKEIIDETTPAYEKMGDAISGVDKLLSIGALTAKQHAQAVSSIRQEYIQGLPVIGKFAGLLTPQGAALGAIGVGATAAAAGLGLMALAARELEQGTAKAFERLDGIGDKAEELGMSASSLQRLFKIGNLADVSQETVSGSLEKMMVNVGKAMGGASKQGAIFDKLGISPADLATSSPEMMFRKVAEEIRKIPSQAEKLSVISEVFGKANLETIRLVENFSELGDKISKGVSGADFSQIDEADRAIKEMVESVESLYDIMAVELAPTIKDIATDLKAAFGDDSARVGVVALAGAVRELTKDIRSLASSATGLIPKEFADRFRILGAALKLSDKFKMETGPADSQNAVAKALAKDRLEENTGPDKSEKDALRAETKAAHEAERKEAALLKKEMAARKKLADDAAKDRNDVLRDIEKAEDHQLIELGMRTKGQAAARDALRKGATQQEADLLMGLTDSKDRKPMDVRNEALSFGSAGAAEAIAKSRSQEANQQEKLIKGLEALTAAMKRFGETGGIKLEVDVQEVEGF